MTTVAEHVEWKRLYLNIEPYNRKMLEKLREQEPAKMTIRKPMWTYIFDWYREDAKRPRFLPGWITLLMVLLCYAGTVVFTFKRSSLLGEEYFYDSKVIELLAAVSADRRFPEYTSFITTAQFYNFLNLGQNADLAALFTVTVGYIGVSVAILRCGGIRMGILPVGSLLMILGLLTIYLTNYTKEIFVLLLVIFLMVLPKARFFDLAFLGAALAFGANFREYWLLVAAAYGLLRLIPLNKLRAWWIAIFVPVLSLLVSCAFIIQTGLPADGKRIEVNVGRIDNGTTGSLITPFVDFPEPCGSVVNVLLTTVFLLFPVPLILTGKVTYMVAAAAITLLWTQTFVASRRFFSGAPSNALRFLSLLLAFTVVQGLFEPDYGSALRHLTPLLPLMLFISNAKGAPEDTRPKFKDLSLLQKAIRLVTG